MNQKEVWSQIWHLTFASFFSPLTRRGGQLRCEQKWSPLFSWSFSSLKSLLRARNSLLAMARPTIMSRRRRKSALFARALCLKNEE